MILKRDFARALKNLRTPLNNTTVDYVLVCLLNTDTKFFLYNVAYILLTDNLRRAYSMYVAMGDLPFHDYVASVKDKITRLRSRA